jgi:hypothetical protein
LRLPNSTAGAVSGRQQKKQNSLPAQPAATGQMRQITSVHAQPLLGKPLFSRFHFSTLVWQCIFSSREVKTQAEGDSRRAENASIF